MRMHHTQWVYFFISAMMALGLVSIADAQVQTLSGTEPPAVYGEEKERVIARERKTRTSRAIQDVAQTYRQMVSAYKAGHIVHAEETSQHLDQLLEDDALPTSFAARMRKKHERFLERVYGESGPLRIDVPSDEISDEEFQMIQTTVESTDHQMPARATRPLVHEEVQQNIAIPAMDKKAEQAARRQKKQDEEKLQRAMQQKEAEAAKERLSQVDEQLRQRQDAARLSRVNDSVESRVADLERAALDLKREEVDQYIHRYREQMQNEQESLQASFLEKVDALYQDGVEFYQKNAYYFANDVFTEVEKLRPDYKMTRQYLADLENHFRLQSLENQADRGRVIMDALENFSTAHAQGEDDDESF